MVKTETHKLDDMTFSDGRISAIQEHLYSELKDEGVILSLQNGAYYGLNEVGRSIWTAIQSPATLQEIEAGIMREYDVDETTCHQEVVTFLQKMAAENLIKIDDEKNS